MFNATIISTFNELELSIYNCILKHKEHISHLKIKDLADEAHVSTATVLRFCKKLGCEGYSEFKIRYKEYLQDETLLRKDIGDASYKNFLSSINSPDFQDSIEHAFSILKQSDRIIFVGIGSSGILGKYGARYFSNVGYFSLYIDDPWLPVLHNVSDSTATIALSESGSTIETLDIAKQLKERGSSLISITNGGDSPLAGISDCSIVYYVSKLSANRMNITTQVPVVYILETLAKKLYTV